MISHHHKCIYVHMPKVAGISIEDVFLEELNLDFDNRMQLLLGLNTNKHIGPPRISHLTAREFLDLKFISQELFDKYYKFTFVRNPYDRVYSFYKYLSYDMIVSFKNFVIKYLPEIIEKEEKGIYYFIQPMCNYIYSSNGELLVDFVGKLENIKEDFQIVTDRLGIQNTELKHKNNSKEMSLKTRLRRVSRIIRKNPVLMKGFIFKNDTSKYFDQEMKNTILRLYSKDFEYFDYEK